jgi:hypothetical protein
LRRFEIAGIGGLQVPTVGTQDGCREPAGHEDHTSVRFVALVGDPVVDLQDDGQE